MSMSSEVTITLGRTGQVVKRKLRDSDIARSESLQSAAIRHRLDRGVNDKPYSHSKRHQGDDSRRISNRDGIKEAQLGHKDLRFKLLRKRSSGLNKSGHDNANGKKSYDTEGDVSTLPSRSSINSNMSLSGPELRRNNAMQFPVTDSGRNSSCMNMRRNDHFPSTSDDLGARSPARNLQSSRSFSPPTPRIDFRGIPSMRPSVVSMPLPQHVTRNEVHDPHRPLQPLPMINPSVVVYRPAAPLPPPNGTFQRSQYMGEPPLSVPGLLHSLGLGKYVIPFQAEEIDIIALKQMSEKDLKDIGIPMGPRKKIVQAIMCISQRPPAAGAPPLPPRPL